MKKLLPLALILSLLISFPALAGLKAVVSSGTSGGGSSTTGVPFTPGGRLTLVSATPIMTVDETAQTTIYYTDYTNDYVPIYGGSAWSEIALSGQISLVLNATDMPASKIYDVYAVNVSGTPTLCSMYWGGATRSTTAGGQSGSANASVTQINGIWVNNAAIASSNCYNNTTSYAISQNQGTLLGSFRTTATNGQTEFVCQPAAASGGTAVDVAVANVYNTKVVNCGTFDNATGITYATAAWATFHTSTTDRVQWLDPLQQFPVSTGMYNIVSNSSAGNSCQIGVALNGTGGPNINNAVLSYSPTSTIGDNPVLLNGGPWSFYPQAGYNFVQAVWYANVASCEFSYAYGMNLGLQTSY